MALNVDEIMNRELFSVRPEESAGDALGYLAALRITGAPVLDEEGRPLGVLSLSDLLGRRDNITVGELMSKPVISIAAKSTIDEAGRLIGETGVHRLVAVNEDGAAVGMVSSIDIIRGLLGMPATHPETFPHYDADTDLVWTDDTPLELERVEAAPDGPGVFAILRGGPGRRESLVWAEGVRDVRARLVELLTAGARGPLGALIGEHGLRFRAARCYGPVGQERVLSILAEQVSPHIH